MKKAILGMVLILGSLTANAASTCSGDSYNICKDNDTKRIVYTGTVYELEGTNLGYKNGIAHYENGDMYKGSWAYDSEGTGERDSGVYTFSNKDWSEVGIKRRYDGKLIKAEYKLLSKTFKNEEVFKTKRSVRVLVDGRYFGIIKDIETETWGDFTGQARKLVNKKFNDIKLAAEKTDEETKEAQVLMLFIAGFFVLLLMATAPARKRNKLKVEAQRIANKKYWAEQAEKERIAEEKKRIAEEEAAEVIRIAEEEAAEAERLIQEQAALAQEKLESDIANLEASLPFYTRNHDESQWKFNGDEMRWNDVVSAIVNDNKFKTTIYLVKVRSLFDDSEHYKVGITTSNVADRFLKSPDVELLEIITEREIENRCALFAEFHFIREFRVSNNPKDKTFSGYTEVIKENSVRKITSLFTHLNEFETKSKSFLNMGLEFNNKGG